MKITFLILLFLLPILLIQSCSKNEKNPIIGKWSGFRYNDSGSKWELTMEFFEDSTFIDEFHQKKKYA